MEIKTLHDAENLVYASFLQAQPYIPKADDSITRNIHLTRQLLDLAGAPDAGTRNILVTGSKGKGSTARFIASLLSHHGYKVGLFTSPHLVNFTERIRVNGKAIPEDTFIRLMDTLAGSVHQVMAGLPRGKYLGPIGIILTAAYLYFKEQQTDFNVIECGRGGRYDDTNVLDNEWAVLTPMTLEHVPQLGPTLEDIIHHKLGIVKAMTQKVFVGKQKKVLPDLEGKEMFCYQQAFTPRNVQMSRAGLVFDVETNKSSYDKLTLPLLGEFQADNAALAIKVCEEIIGNPLEKGIIDTTFRDIQWPGRCEILAKDPIVLLDGAINRQSARYLTTVIEALDVSKVVTLIAVSEDKDYLGVISVCASFSETLIITEPEHSHKSFPKDALNKAKQYQFKSMEIKPIKEAIATAYDLKPELILIVGTQTAIGEVKKIMGYNLLDIGM